MKGSGKQVLLGIIRRLSGSLLSTPDQLNTATDEIRAGLLIQGSSSSDYHAYANSLNWASHPTTGKVRYQGVSLGVEKILVSDLLEQIFECPGLEEHILSRNEGMTKTDFEAGLWALWTMISALQMHVDDLAIEVDDSELPLDDWIRYMSEKHDLFNSGEY